MERVAGGGLDSPEKQVKQPKLKIYIPTAEHKKEHHKTWLYTALSNQTEREKRLEDSPEEETEQLGRRQEGGSRRKVRKPGRKVLDSKQQFIGVVAGGFANRGKEQDAGGTVAGKIWSWNSRSSV